MRIPAAITISLLATVSALLISCERHETHNAGITQNGIVEDTGLDEISGMQRSALNSNVYFVHNDDGEARVFALDDSGHDLGSFLIAGATNRDWEDITAVSSDNVPLLVISDSGDNFAQHPSVTLYFVREPTTGSDGRYSGEWPLEHSINLTYPDGARDCESVAWDPASDRIILISKRDKPSRIYSIDRSRALTENNAMLDAHGEMHTFRPPTVRDQATFGARDAAWVSQPTGMDISADGRMAAVISYRSIYLFERRESEDWETAFRRKPLEFEGPPSKKEEAISFSDETTDNILVTTEGLPAPVYRFRLID